MNDQRGGAFNLIGQGLAMLLGQAIGATPQWAALSITLDYLRDDVQTVKELLVALTANQQAAVNELASGINTLSTRLVSVLDGAQATRDALAAMAAEEGREQAERERLEALVAQMDADVVDALTPLSAQVSQMNEGLQTPSSTGGGPLDTTGGDSGGSSSPPPPPSGAI